MRMNISSGIELQMARQTASRFFLFMTIFIWLLFCVSLCLNMKPIISPNIKEVAFHDGDLSNLSFRAGIYRSCCRLGRKMIWRMIDRIQYHNVVPWAAVLNISSALTLKIIFPFATVRVNGVCTSISQPIFWCPFIMIELFVRRIRRFEDGIAYFQNFVLTFH